MEGLDIGLLVALGVDSLIVLAIYCRFIDRRKTLIDIQGTKEFDVNALNSAKVELPKVIEYGMVIGKAVPVEATKVLHSNFDKQYKGVVRLLELHEHSTSVRDNIVRDTRRLMSSVVNHEPFKLTKKNCEILVEQPMTADYIKENLRQTYNNFEVNMESLTSKVVTAIVAKETVKGIETTESMLLNGTTLTCFGRLEQGPYTSSWVPGTLKYQYRLTPPSSDYTYIITSMSRDELVDDLKFTTKVLKWSLIVFGSIGLGIGAYLTWKHGYRFVEKKRREYRLRQARLKRIADRQARSGTAGEQTQTTENSCVICLVCPREVILLDCGHVCLCMDCLEMMPTRNCPICRQEYRSFAPAYIA